MGANPVKFDGYYFSEESNVSLADVLKMSRDSKARYNFTGALLDDNYGEHWLWLDAKSVDASAFIFLIELAWLDRIEFYAVASNGDFKCYQSGDDRSFGDRAIAFRKPAFPVLQTIEGSPVELFAFKIGAQGRLSFPALTLSEKSFDEQRDLDHFFYGGIVAILLALGAYNATIFFSLRENVHFYYMFYIFAFGFLQIIASGLAQQYLWPERENLSSLNAHIFLALTNFSITYFVIHFISLKEYSNTLSRVLRSLAWLSLSCVPFLFFFDYYPFKTILHACSFTIMALIFPAAIYTLLRGNAVAHYLLASNIVLFPSVAIGLLRFLGLFEDAYWAEHLSELGIAAEALILSVGLAYRVNMLREEKDSIALTREIERSSFANKVIQSKEEERKIIGKALHDSLGHKILTIKSAIHSADEALLANEQGLLEVLDEAIEEVRDLSHLLYPSILDHLGLKKSISSILRSSLGPAGIEYELDFSLNPDAVSYEAQLVLYRATQECVNNLLKHSDASEFRVSIRALEDSEILFYAEDNGSRSYGEQDYGYGLSMLKQQADMLGGTMISETTLEKNLLSFNFFDQTSR